MSIATDLRSYADTAIGQGKQVIDQAQAQFAGVAGQARQNVSGLAGQARQNVSGLTSKASVAVNDLRAQAEKAINLDAIKAAVEPYVAQAKGYSTSVTDRAEDVFSTVRSDKRVGALISRAEGITGVVVETVQQRVVKPAQSIAGRNGNTVADATPAATPAEATPERPAARKTTARKAPAKKTTAK